MSMSIGNNYSSLFSSLNGKYNAANDMAALSAQRSQITSGSYGKLMKAYVGKVGNKAALNAYRSSGSTVNSATDLNADTASTAQTSSVSSKKTVARSNFLDSHLSSIGKTKQSSATAAGKSYLDQHLSGIDTSRQSGVEKAIAYAEEKTGRAIAADGSFINAADKPAANAEAVQAAQQKYAGMQSSWLDDHLKSYNESATVQTAANTSVAIDTTA
ncbi:MAG: hypothetical protein IJP92_05650 [Lachnospiraceae bacterium]|nr:hypothetical protein [Lachnospiraceae bacterium]